MLTPQYLVDDKNRYIGIEMTYSDGELDITQFPPMQDRRTFIKPLIYDAAIEIPVWETDRWVLHQLSEYVEPQPTLDDLKTLKRAEIAELRYAQEIGGCEWNGHIVSTDRDSRAILMSSKMVAEELGELFTSLRWKLYNDTFISITLSDMKDMGLTIGAYVQALFTKEDELNTLISNATTAEELNLITWG